ncbi:MAG: hypothetical protein K0R39_773 [Symbiobacteriaceae bacterium]|jgi:hypothetical protein|nr:hypothetical protein [Symbiobacteriaceae bacterium]
MEDAAFVTGFWFGGVLVAIFTAGAVLESSRRRWR